MTLPLTARAEEVHDGLSKHEKKDADDASRSDDGGDIHMRKHSVKVAGSIHKRGKQR